MKESHRASTPNLSDPQSFRRFFPHLNRWSPNNTPTNTPNHIRGHYKETFINSHTVTKEISNGLEDNKRVTSFKERYTTDRNIWSILHTWTQRPGVDNKTLSVYRLTIG